MLKRKAVAQWQGPGKTGNGNLTTDSTILNHTQYSFSSRFETGIGTNPEELVAAAHAGCFSMKLSFVLGEAGFTAELIETSCVISLANGSIHNSHLILEATVPGISQDIFTECVMKAKNECPISKLLHTDISIEYTLKA